MNLISRNPKCNRNGKPRHPLYNTWNMMLGRCYNANATSYSSYGKRGILVCEEWHHLQNFIDWSEQNGWSSNLTLDRIDNNKGYSPDNCRWSTRVEQGNNLRNNRYVTAFGETKTMSMWARDIRCVVSVKALDRRIVAYGWNPEEAITKPIMCKGKKNGSFIQSV